MVESLRAMDIIEFQLALLYRDSIKSDSKVNILDDSAENRKFHEPTLAK